MAVQYTYLATDLATNTVLGELPVQGVQLDRQLNVAGHMSAGMKLDDPRVDNNSLLDRTTPGKTAFWAYRENTIVWGGIILTREYQSDGKSVSLTGQTFEVYPSRRYPWAILGQFLAVEAIMGQSYLIAYLWQQLQSIANGSIGVEWPAFIPNPDPQTSLLIQGYDLSTSYGDYIKSVTQINGGPDWCIGYAEDGNGLPRKILQVGAPIGAPLTDLIVDYPGSVANYVYTENISAGANQWYAVGSGASSEQVVGVAFDSNSLASGYPLWESVNQYSGVTDQTTINGHASADLLSLPAPLTTHIAALIAKDSFPAFGSYGLGDFMAVNVVDPRFPQGVTFNVRPIGWTINPPDESSNVESVNLVFDEPTGGGGA